MGRKMYTSDAIERIACGLVETYGETTEAQRKAGRTWYTRAYNATAAIAGDTGRPIERVALALSALSPLKRWEQNLVMARALCSRKTYRNPGTFGRFARTAWGCLTGDVTELTGLKTHFFAKAILGDTQAVVIDRHMITLTGHPTPWLTDAQYGALATAVTIAARRVGEHPRDLQAILWVALRDGEAADSTPF